MSAVNASLGLGSYLLGVAFFVGTVGAVALAAAVLLHRRFAHLTGSPRIVAFGLLLCAGVVIAHLAPAALGLLHRWSALAAAALLVIAVARLRRVAPGPADRPPPGPRSSTASWIVAVVAVAAVGVWFLAFLREHATVAVTHSDYVTFTMPQIARWIQSATVWKQIEFNPRYPVGTYPNSGDTWFLAFVLPWRNDAFVRLATYPLLGLTGVGIYGLARELRASAAHAALFAALALATRVVTIPAIDYVKPDCFMLAGFAGGALFLVRGLRARRTSDLVLAGIGLGLAFGSRWYGVPFVAVLVGLWAVGSLVERRGLRPTGRQAVVVVAVIAAVGGFWLVRNVAVTGDPVFPAKVAALGVTVFDAPRDVVLDTTGFSIADYAGRPAAFRRYILPEWKTAIGASGVVIGLAVLIAIGRGIAGVRKRRGAFGDRAGVGVAGAAFVIACIYVVSPATAQGRHAHPYPGLVAANSRYLAPALILGAAAGAWALATARRWRPLFELVALAAVIEGLVGNYAWQPGGIAPFDLRASSIAEAVAVILIALAAAVAIRALSRRVSRPTRHRLLVGSVVAAIAVAIAAGYVDQRHFNDRRYRGADATIDWVLDHASSGHRIGTTGVWNGVLLSPNLPAFGPRFGNYVAFIGPIERGMLQYYERRGAFLNAVRRGRYDLVIVGRGFIPMAAPSREQRWLRSAGFKPVTSSPRFVLMRSPHTPRGPS